MVFNAGRKLLVDTDAIKHKFYTVCNCLLGNTYSLNEILHINLQDSYFLSILQYAAAAVKLTKAQISELNACWNFVYRKMFGFYEHESVRIVIYGLGRHDFCHIRLLLVYKLIIMSLASTIVTVTNLAHLFMLSKEYKNMFISIGLSSDIMVSA